MNKQLGALLVGWLLLLSGASGLWAANNPETGQLSDIFTSDLQPWEVVTSGAQIQIQDKAMEITTAIQANNKYRGDIKRTGGVVLHAGLNPIVAMRLERPDNMTALALTFDTNLGQYGNGNNKYKKDTIDKVGEILYWDLTKNTFTRSVSGSNVVTTFKTTDTTILSLFQFKLADIMFTGISAPLRLHWVRTFASLEQMREVLTSEVEEVDPIAFTFKHPGLLHNTADLQRIKELAHRGEGRFVASYELLKKNNQASATYEMKGPYKQFTRAQADVAKADGTMVPGSSAKAGAESDVMAAYYNALMYTITEDEAHAQKAVEILNGYANTTTSIVTGGSTDEQLNGLYGFMLANAAELIRATYPAWSAQEIEQCKTMLKTVFYPVLQNFSPCSHANWDIICMKALMAIAVFSDDKPMYDHVVNYFYNGVGNGSISRYVVTDAGQLEESNRDQGHCFLGLGCIAEVAEMAYKQGLDDLYGALDNAIMRGYEYTAKYNLGNDVPYQYYDHYREGCSRHSDYDPTKISDRGRGGFRAVFEIAYNHYVVRKGKSMPYSLQVLQRGPEGALAGADNVGYGSLTFYLGTDLDYPPVDVDPNSKVGLLEYSFATQLNGWVATGIAATIKDGQAYVPLGESNESGKKRNDFQKKGGDTLHVGNYPIIAIKFKKPSVCNLTFDTNYGSYGNGSNKWTGVLGDDHDIYYYDMSADGKGFGAGANQFSTVASTPLTTFQFKIADITSSETFYTVDWIRTAKTLDDLFTEIKDDTTKNDTTPTGVRKQAFDKVVCYRTYDRIYFENLEEDVEVAVYSLMGAQLLSSRISAPTASVSWTKQGVYIVTIYNTKGKRSFKIVN